MKTDGIKYEVSLQRQSKATAREKKLILLQIILLGMLLLNLDNRVNLAICYSNTSGVQTKSAMSLAIRILYFSIRCVTHTHINDSFYSKSTEAFFSPRTQACSIAFDACLDYEAVAITARAILITSKKTLLNFVEGVLEISF